MEKFIDFKRPVRVSNPRYGTGVVVGISPEKGKDSEPYYVLWDNPDENMGFFTKYPVDLLGGYIEGCCGMWMRLKKLTFLGPSEEISLEIGMRVKCDTYGEGLVEGYGKFFDRATTDDEYFKVVFDDWRECVGGYMNYAKNGTCFGMETEEDKWLSIIENLPYSVKVTVNNNTDAEVETAVDKNEVTVTVSNPPKTKKIVKSKEDLMNLFLSGG